VFHRQGEGQGRAARAGEAPATGRRAPGNGRRIGHRAVWRCRGLGQLARAHALLRGILPTMPTSEIAHVLAWDEALIDQDFDTLVSLSSDDVEVGDAGGAAQGHAALL